MKSVLFLPFISQLAFSILIEPQPFAVIENNNLTIRCIAEAGESSINTLSVGGTLITSLPRFLSAMLINGGTSYSFGPLNRSDTGLVFLCRNEQQRSATLQVNCE